MKVWLWTLASVGAVSLFSLVGIATLSTSDKNLRRALFVMVGLAVGALLGDAFLHLIPQSYEKLGFGPRVPALILGGMGSFFLLEKFLHWRHQHDLEGHQEVGINGGHGHIHPVGPMNLVANGVHNFVDGVLIGAAFLSGPSIGVATTVAIVMHEIPQEIGNFAVLIHAGYSRGRALVFNFLAGCTAIAGAILSLLIGNTATHFSAWMLPIAAGGFIYIAGCDLVPQLHRETRPLQSLAQLVAIAVGAGLMFAMLLLEGHQ